MNNRYVRQVCALALAGAVCAGGVSVPVTVKAESTGTATVELGGNDTETTSDAAASIPNNTANGSVTGVSAGTTVSGFSVMNNPTIVEDAGVTIKDLDKNYQSGAKLAVFDVSSENEKPEIHFKNASKYTVNGLPKAVNSAGNLELPNKGKYKVVATTVNSAGVVSESALYVLNLTTPAKNGNASLSVSSKKDFKFSTDLKEKIEDAVNVRNVSSGAKVTYWHASVDNYNSSDTDYEWVKGLPTTAGKFKVKATIAADLAKYYLPQETKSVMMTISKSSELITTGKVMVSSQEMSSEINLPFDISKYVCTEDDLTKGKVELSGNAAKLVSGKPEISADGKLLVTLKDDAIEKNKSTTTGKIKIKFSELTNCTLTVNCDFVITPYEVMDITVSQEDGVYGSSLPAPEVLLSSDGSVLESSSVRFSYCAKGSSRMTSTAPKTAGEYVVQADYSSGSASDRIVGCASAEFKVEKFELRIAPKLTPWTEGMPASKLNEKIGYVIEDGEKLIGTDKFATEPYYKVDTQSYTGIENDCPIVVANKSEALAGLTNCDSYDVIFDEDQVVRVTDEGLVIQFDKNAYVWGDIVVATVQFNREDVTASAKISYILESSDPAQSAVWTDGFPSLPGVYKVKAVWGNEATIVPLEIAKKTVMIRPKDVTIGKGAKIPSIEYTIDGLTVDAVANAPVFKIMSSDGKTAINDTNTSGEYSIVVATDAVFKEPSLYQAVYQPGKLIITTDSTPDADTPSDNNQGTNISIADTVFTGITGIDGIFRTESGDILANKIVTVGSVMYVTDTAGKMLTSQFITTENGNKYYATKTGAIAVNKIITVSGKKYFCNADGTIAKSKFCTTAKGSTVYAKKTYALVSNATFTVNKKKYFAKASCAILKGGFAKTKYSNKVYARSNGTLYTSTLFKVDGKKYYAKRSGAILTNKWVKVGNTKYYCNASGKITKSKKA